MKKRNKSGIIVLIILSLISIWLHLSTFLMFGETPGDNYMLVFIIMLGHLLIGVIRMIISIIIKYRNLWMVQDFFFVVMLYVAMIGGSHQSVMFLGMLFSMIFIVISVISINKYAGLLKQK